MQRTDHPAIDRWICYALVGVTLAVYGQVAGHGFVIYDDPEYVIENPHVRAGLSAASVAWALTGIHAATWHPLTSWSHMLDIELFGLTPAAHLLVNMLLHAASAVLLFVALGRMSGVRWPSALVAAGFALHPLHVESVAWVSERKDVLSTLFWMLTLLAYAAYARRANRRYALVVLVFALGLMAKPMLVTLPFVLLLLDYWPLGRLRIHSPSPLAGEGQEGGSGVRFAASAPFLTFPRKGGRNSFLVLEKIPLLALAAAVSVITVYAQRHAGAVASLDDISFGARLANAIVSYATYLVKMVAPLGLAPFYPMRSAIPAWEVAGAALLLAAISALALWQARTRPYLLVGWGWYLGTLVPVIGLIKQGEQAAADRFTYVPLIGVFIMLAWGLADLAGLRGWRPRRVGAAAGAALAACALLAAHQVALWHDSETLFRHTVAVTTDNYVAHANLGAVLLARGDVDAAAPHFEAAARLRPQAAKVHCNLGIIAAARGDRAGAMAHYEEALRRDPVSPLAHFNLGVALGQEGRSEQAIAHYRAALESNPDYAKAHNNLGVALAARSEQDAALAHYRAAVRLQPDLLPARTNLAIALETAGHHEEALEHYTAAAQWAPQDPLARLNLGTALAEHGRLEDAIVQYREAVRLRPDLDDARVALSQALARQGDGARP